MPTLLVVDDHQSSRDALCAHSEERGYKVRNVKNGQARYNEKDGESRSTRDESGHIKYLRTLRPCIHHPPDRRKANGAIIVLAEKTQAK